MVMNNEPVAWRTHYPSGWEYKDGNPPFELKGNSQLLYTHPADLTDEELVAHVPLMAWEVFSSSLFRLEDNEITNDEFIKRCYEVVKARCNHPQPDYTQFNTQVHPFKTLTDENYEVVFDGEKYTTKLKEQEKTLTDEDLTLILEVLIDSYDDTNRCYLEYEAIWKNSPTRKAKLDGMKRMVDKHTHAIEMVEAILRKEQEK